MTDKLTFTINLVARDTYSERQGWSKQDWAEATYPGLTYDCALPQPWVDACGDYDPRLWWVWGYPESHSTFGLPLPLCVEAVREIPAHRLPVDVDYKALTAVKAPVPVSSYFVRYSCGCVGLPPERDTSLLIWTCDGNDPVTFIWRPMGEQNFEALAWSELERYVAKMQAVLRDADIALYKAKARGGNLRGDCRQLFAAAAVKRLFCP